MIWTNERINEGERTQVAVYKEQSVKDEGVLEID
jgi:hypothetical protein